MNQVDTLIDAQTLRNRIEEMGRTISADFRGRGDLVIIPVLKGSFLFAADLVRTIDIPLSVDFLALRSYEGTESTGVVQITSDLTHPIEGKDVVVVEDIVDTGLTMDYLIKNLRTRAPRSLRLASLLHKPARTRVPIEIDYLGFTIEDVFVVGYGLDFNEHYRNLPFIGIMRP